MEIQLSERAQQLKKGLYQHFKGQQYLVLGVALDSETLQEVVVYQAQYGAQQIWVRPIEMFYQHVERDGQSVPRFKYIGANEQETKN